MGPLIPVVQCDFCGCADTLHWKTRDTPEWDAVRRYCRETGDLESPYLRIPETFTYVRCARCGLVFTNPRLSDEVVDSFYDDYMGGRFAGLLPAYDTDFRAEFQALVAGELERGLKDRPAGFRRFLWRPVRNLVDRALPMRALDVGCAHGPMLRCFRAKGWRPRGIDVSARAAAIARNMERSGPATCARCSISNQIVRITASRSSMFWNMSLLLRMCCEAPLEF